MYKVFLNNLLVIFTIIFLGTTNKSDENQIPAKLILLIIKSFYSHSDILCSLCNWSPPSGVFFCLTQIIINQNKIGHNLKKNHKILSIISLFLHIILSSHNFYTQKMQLAPFLIQDVYSIFA